MTVTHGTRSSYNRGCRCDACREASRLARARQRAVATERISRTEPSLRTPSPWVFVALLAGAGVGSLWNAKRLRTEEEPSGAAVWPWVVSGLTLLAVAAGVAVTTVWTGLTGLRGSVGAPNYLFPYGPFRIRALFGTKARQFPTGNP